MYIDVNGVTLYYEQSGQGSPLILLHGNGEDHTVFAPLAKKLSAHFTVYAADSRGHGKSSGQPPLDYETMAYDAMSFINALKLAHPALLGFSDGGIIGLIIAMQRPQLLSRLIACGANLEPAGLKRGPRLFFSMLRRIRRDPLLDLMCTEPHIPPEALAGIRIPVLVTAGQRDLIRESHTRLIAAHIPDGRLHILPGEGHGSYLVHTDRFSETAYGFLCASDPVCAAHAPCDDPQPCGSPAVSSTADDRK